MSSLARFDDQEVLIQFDDNPFQEDIAGSTNPYQEDFGDKVNEAQEKLSQLRHEQERLEREKQELEELHARKEDFLRGRTDLVDKFTRYSSALERESCEAQKRSEQYLDTKDLFEHHLRSIQALRPEQWSRAELRAELNRAANTIDDAEDDLLKSAAVVENLKSAPRIKGGGASPFTGQASFTYWMKAGLAFTLPLAIVGIIATILMLLTSGS
jgi:hypothetical protein